MSALLLILLSAVLVNVIVLTSVAAWRPFVGVTGAFAASRAIAGASALVAPLTAGLSWLLWRTVLVRWDLEYLRTFSFVAILLIVVSVVEFVLRRRTQLNPQRPGFALLMTTNAAAFGVALLAQIRMRSLFGALLFSLTAAAAFAVLLLAFAAMHERLRGADVPSTFREAPLALVTAGLIALGFMGFSGLIQE
ncbi:MAG: Rnf-Nqr domain containing protein [Steroidobacter sp.]